MGKRSRKKKKPAKRQQAASPLPEDEPSQSPEPADPYVEAESALPDEVESEALPIESVNEPIPKPAITSRNILSWLGVILGIVIAWGLGAWIRLQWPNQLATIAGETRVLATQTVPALQSQLNEAGLDAIAGDLATAKQALTQAGQLGQRFRRFNQPADINATEAEFIQQLAVAANAMQAAAGKSSALAGKYEEPVRRKAALETSGRLGEVAADIIQLYSRAARVPGFKWQGKFLPTTNDSYLFASTIKQSAQADTNATPFKKHPTATELGAVTLLGRSLARAGYHPSDIITYLPALMAGLLAIPMVLLGRLYGSTLAGIGAACIAVVAFSYFNRTNAGYYDTDMFSVTVPAFILYFLLRAHRQESFFWLTAAALGIFIYPFFYIAGVPIVTALGVAFMGYRGLVYVLQRMEPNLAKHFVAREPADSAQEKRSSLFTLASVPLLGTAIIMCPSTMGVQFVMGTPEAYYGAPLLLAMGIMIWWLERFEWRKIRPGMIAAAALTLIWLVGFSSAFERIRYATIDYLPGVRRQIQQTETRPANSLVYKNVKETIVEAKVSPWSEVMVRISGSELGCLLALAGYVLLVIIFPETLIALPFVGIGIFAHYGGHRFTIHAVPIAALAAALLPMTLLEYCRRISALTKAPTPDSTAWPSMPMDYFKQFGNWIFATGGVRVVAVGLATLMVWPNIQQAQARNSYLGTVLNSQEVQLIDDLRKASKPGDYVHTWWDWGTAIWYHADRNILTHPGMQSADTYVCAKIMTTGSQRLAAHLARASVEYYHHGSTDSNGTLAVDHLFADANRTPEQILDALENRTPVQSEGDKDVFLYLPYQLITFYSVLHQFSERNLNDGTEYPIPQLVPLRGGWERKGPVTLIKQASANGQVGLKYYVDINKLTVTDLGQGLDTSAALKFFQQGRHPFSGYNIVSMQMKGSSDLVHFASKSMQIGSGGFKVTTLEGKTGSIPIDEVIGLFPAFPVRQVDFPNSSETFAAQGADYNRTRLHVVCSQDPPMAVIADQDAFRSQTVQLLLMNKADPKYFEPVSSNQTGRVFKLKK